MGKGRRFCSFLFQIGRTLHLARQALFSRKNIIPPLFPNGSYIAVFQDGKIMAMISRLHNKKLYWELPEERQAPLKIHVILQKREQLTGRH